ncbi:CDP-glycerol glycerophosphotransferase family protein [bacterium]|nr:CDP-glycerol glycerophosphotransferase family protein [bacterium]
MPPVYYFFNQAYQFSNALPLYRRLGGTVILKKTHKFFQFVRYLRGLNRHAGEHTFLHTPAMKICKPADIKKLKGVIISLSTATMRCDPALCKTIFIGHGTGDKKYDSHEKLLEQFDYIFLSGPKHREKLKDVGIDLPAEKLVDTGNLRFDDYLNSTDRGREMERMGIADRSRKNVLYAPTWKWGDGTLDKYAMRFAREITRKYNLIIRPHHMDRRRIPLYKLRTRLEGLSHVYFSNPGDLLHSDTMQDFRISDILISDTSSILYEYLITGNPVIVAANEFNDLHHMPDTMNIMKHVTLFREEQDIVDLIGHCLEDGTSRSVYNRMLHDCFSFNDGKSVDRAVRFIQTLLPEQS